MEDDDDDWAEGNPEGNPVGNKSNILSKYDDVEEKALGKRKRNRMRIAVDGQSMGGRGAKGAAGKGEEGSLLDLDRDVFKKQIGSDYYTT